MAGARCDNHLAVHVDGERYYLHRLIWFMVTGIDPNEEIDHKNTVGFDNRWRNLRLKDRSGNCHNTRLRKDNRSGIRGVQRHPDNIHWRVQIRVRGVRFHGKFVLKKEALRYAKSIYASVT